MPLPEDDPLVPPWEPSDVSNRKILAWLAGIIAAIIVICGCSFMGINMWIGHEIEQGRETSR
ncbi:hypothetical protein Q0Z83_089560 [Actinoplanes sichuanensis]|nr:hypothetical protein Q0Z83_089550 [Actinoplanes sichuanensis]BEL10765.1 hypothetical protein Q0Z83_089560 [Actinoplanes sichuanensis]